MSNGHFTAQRLPLRQRRSAWLALLLVVFQALLPVVSHAVVAQTQPISGKSWVEVCTVSGMAWVRVLTTEADAVDVSDAPPDAPGSTPFVPIPMSMGNCDWCATHPSLSSLPPSTHLAPVALVRWHSHPPAFFHAPRLLAVWASAHSRAPPVWAF